MNKIINILLLLLLVIFISFRVTTACGELQKDEKAEPAIPGLPKTYSGTLPCADCPGTGYFFQVQKDSFTELSWDTGRNPDPFEKTGSWELHGDTLFALQDGEFYKSFLYREHELVLLTTEQQQVTGDSAGYYRLERIMSEESIRARYAEFREEGIDFIASGNEPFWSVRINTEISLLYITPGDSIRAASPQVQETDSSAIYTADTGSQTITLHAEEKYCVDSMSGFLFTHTVTAETGDPELLHGCGIYLDEI
ncbi:MAG: copper resistance protein NlpE N-terminal domain-containing protein [Balneolaceae bacterium]